MIWITCQHCSSQTVPPLFTMHVSLFPLSGPWANGPSPPRWAQFFICPLMIRDAIDREVEAVDSGESYFYSLHSSRRPSHVFSSSSSSSEYQLAKPSDSHRKEMLFGSLAKPGHPMGKFCWGELVNTTAGTAQCTQRCSPPWGMLCENKQQRWDSCQVFPLLFFFCLLSTPCIFQSVCCAVSQLRWMVLLSCVRRHQETPRRWSRSRRSWRSTSTSVCGPSGRSTTLPTTWPWPCSPKVSKLLPINYPSRTSLFIIWQELNWILQNPRSKLNE